MSILSYAEDCLVKADLVLTNGRVCMVILAQDMREIPPEAIKDTDSVYTITNGTIVNK